MFSARIAALALPLAAIVPPALPVMVDFLNAGGVRTQASSTNPLPITCISGCGSGPGSGLTDVELRAAPVPVSGPLTDAQLRAVGVPVTGTFWQATQPVSGTVTATGPLTDTQLRAAAVPVSLATLPALTAGTANIGDVDVASMPSVTVGTFPDNEPVNVALINGAAPSLTGSSLNVNCTGGCGSPSTPVTYQWQTPDAVGGANKLHADFFNAAGSGKVVRVLGIYPVIKTDVAVTGALALRFDLYRTSAVGTGGTAASYKSATADVAGGNITPFDTNNANLPAQVTARHLPAGGATIAEWMLRGQCFVEETNAATYLCGGQTNFASDGNLTTDRITLHEGQGLLLKQGGVATVNNIGFRVVFSLE